MTPNHSIEQIEVLLKSGTAEHIELALALASSQQLDYDFYAFAELAFFLSDYEPINPHLPIQQIIHTILGYGWFELENRGIRMLPPSIGCFLNLRTLHLESNDLSDLPPSFGKLHELKKLYLNGNPLQTLPTVVCQLPKLELLDLSYAALTELPAEIAQLSQLSVLNLQGNPIELPMQASIKALLPNTEIAF